MKLTEHKLRSIIREELSRLNERRKTVRDLADALHGKRVDGASLQKGMIVVLDVEGKVAFKASGAFKPGGDGRQQNLSNAVAQLQGSVIEYAANEGDDLRVHLDDGTQIMFDLAKRPGIEIDPNLPA